MVAFMIFALGASVHRAYSLKLSNFLGPAEWIWIPRTSNEPSPIVFFAARSFAVPADREFVRISLSAHPEYELYVNGRLIGGAREMADSDLHRYELADFTRVGLNRIVVAVRSPKGVGGLIAGIDFGVSRRNLVVTDGSWVIFDRWNDSILGGNPEFPAIDPDILGRPPFGRWTLSELHDRTALDSKWEIQTPLARFGVDSRLPDIRVVSGVAVAGAVPMKAEVFDFGPVYGRLKLVPKELDDRLIRVRFVSTPEELEHEGAAEELVLARGEESVVEPEERHLRYVAVYGPKVEAVVLSRQH